MTKDEQHSEGPLPPPTLVEDAGGFGVLLGLLEGSHEIAIDTEADSFYRYRERVCLIQVTVGDEDFVVDPLCDFDLSGLGGILADPRKTKVFHDGEYDVLILKRDYGFEFAGLFDTRIAAAALGVNTPGLASVVGEHFGVELDKSQQRSDWSRRPLTTQQIDYARQDTHYLIPLMHRMRADLEKAGRAPIVEGECRRLEGLIPRPHEFQPDEFLRIKGARNLDPRRMQALRELYIWRDEQARGRDVPPFKVLGNSPMMDLARCLPRSMQHFSRVPGLSPKITRRFGSDLIAVLRQADAKGPLKKVPRLPPKDGTGGMDELEHELHDRLKAWRKERASQEGIDSSLILNRHTLRHVAKARPGDAAALGGIEGVVEWQLGMLGEEILGVVTQFEEDLTAGRITFGARRARRR